MPRWPVKCPPHWRKRIIASGWICAGLASTCYFVLPLAFPLPDKITAGPGESIVLLDRDGHPLDHLVRPDFYRHRTVELDLIPKPMVQATLAAEDKRFYQHGGIDWRATARAIRDSWDQQRFVSGASTITQQTIKICSPRRPRSFKTKFIECLSARHLEMTETKQNILSAYFNHLDYGNRSQGPLQAARHYFGKPLGQLSLAECALLAGLPQAPSRLNPRRNPEAAVKRRNWILDRMHIVYQLDPERIERAKAEPLQLAPRHTSGNATPHNLALRHPLRQLTRNSRSRSITTSLSAPLQTDITRLVRNQLERLSDKHIQHAAVVVIHNPSGEIRAYLGTPDFSRPNGGQIDATQIPRSPGSALKPFTFLLAYQRAGMTPASIVPDIPTCYPGPLGAKQFVNYDRRYRGPVTLHHALANSLNIPAIRILNRSGGSAPLVNLLQQYGISTLDQNPGHYGLGLTLGSAEVSLFELTNAYATLARMGKPLPATFLPSPDQVLPPTTVQHWMLAESMSDNPARTAAFGPSSQLRLPFPCAVKTGTSTDFRDNWCLGFTSEFTVGVWVGNLDNTPMRGISGVTGAAPIFHSTMLRLHQNKPASWWETPPRMTRCSIHPQTGKQLSDHNPASIRLTLPDQQLPGFQHSDDYDSQGRIRLDTRYAQWLEKHGDQSSFVIAETLPLPHSLQSALTILSPSQHATYLLDPDLPGKGQQLPLLTDFPGQVSWSSPTLEISVHNGNASATLTPGNHSVSVTDNSGRTSTRSFHVKEL